VLDLMNLVHNFLEFLNPQPEKSRRESDIWGLVCLVLRADAPMQSCDIVSELCITSNELPKHDPTDVPSNQAVLFGALPAETYAEYARILSESVRLYRIHIHGKGARISIDHVFKAKLSDSDHEVSKHWLTFQQGLQGSANRIRNWTREIQKKRDVQQSSQQLADILASFNQKSFLSPAVPCYNLPSRLNKAFMGRDEHMTQLTGHAQDATANLKDLCVGIHGPPGVGKTQLALQFAFASKTSATFEVELWVSAATPEKMSDDFFAAAEKLRILPSDASPHQRATARDRVCDWLSTCGMCVPSLLHEWKY
jgi:hypothetical protein